jgi:hypothetical protein
MGINVWLNECMVAWTYLLRAELECSRVQVRVHHDVPHDKEGLCVCLCALVCVFVCVCACVCMST